MDTQLLFSTVPVVLAPMAQPVIVVGLPRSGSSMLSNFLSTGPDYFVFDDLYLHRQAMAVGAKGVLNPEQLERLIFFLGWQLRARLKNGVFTNTRTGVSLPDVDRFDDALRETFANRPVTWHGLMEEWLGRLALAQGKTRWGFKAPQDFMHIDKYVRLMPDVKFIYLCRDPRRVMASLKQVRRHDGDPRQYQPYVYAKYWRMASDAVERAEAVHGGRLLCIRFEDLVSQPEDAARELGEFLDSSFSVPDMSQTNSSFSGKEPARRSALSGTEALICERVAGRAMVQRGYDLGQGTFAVRDIPDLVSTTSRFAMYQVRRVIRDPAARHSVKQFLLRS